MGKCPLSMQANYANHNIYGQYIRFQIIMYGYVQVIPVNQNLRLQTAPRAQFPTIDFLLLALNTVKKKS